MNAKLLASLLLTAILLPAAAFPPAPDHVIYGLVRDEQGHPVNVAGAKVILTTGSGVEIKTTIRPNLEPTVNYRLRVPLDSGLTAIPYQPTALQPTAPFRLSVKIGTVIYLPIEMVGDLKNLGDPARETRVDLTLGEDTDGDGLPDAWERNLLKAGQTLADINAGDDSDNDGMSNLNEYLAGTYAFDAADGFTLEIASVNAGRPILEFTVITGRTYRIRGSADLKQWSTVNFSIPAEGPESPARPQYQAPDVFLLRVEAQTDGNSTPFAFFRLVVE
jgi:hypothetical protein